MRQAGSDQTNAHKEQANANTDPCYPVRWTRIECEEQKSNYDCERTADECSQSQWIPCDSVSAIKRRIQVTPPERVMRTMKYAFIMSVLLFIFVTIRVPSKAAHHPGPSLELIIIAIALTNLAMGWAGRPILRRLTKANAGRDRNAALLNQWMSANILGFALIESCALFAVVLHMLGSSIKLVGLLFGCALLALFAWSPGAPPTTENLN